MLALPSRILFLLSCLSVAASTLATTSSFARHPQLFGVPRGGGLFGGKSDAKYV